MKRTCIALCTLLWLTSPLFGQGNRYDLVPPHLDVKVVCVVTFDGSNGIFRYAYFIDNLKTSIGYMAGFDIDIAYPSNGAEVALSDLTDLKHVWRDPLGFPDARRVIPVGVPQLPDSGEYTSTWWAAFGVDGSLEWTSPYGRFNVAPGGKLDGIVITSHGVPTLRSFVVSPSYHPKPPVEITPENEQTVEESTEAEDSVELALEDSIKVRGWTVGPTAPPADLSALSWIDTLASYKHQCVTLGWLTNGPAHEKEESDDRADEGIVERLDRRLDKAKDALAKSDSVKAKLELELFAKEVDQLYHKNKEEGERRGVPSLTSEGYALLKYNAEYLIDRLPDRHGRGDEGEHRGKK